MARLEALSPAVDLAAVRAEWLGVGLRTTTEPLTREQVAPLVADVYAVAGLPAPMVVLLEGPLAGIYGAALLAQAQAQVCAQVQAQVWEQVREQVWEQVREQVWAQVCAQVQAQVQAQLWEQVWEQVGAQVWAQVQTQVQAQVQVQVWAQVQTQVREQVWEQVCTQVRAQVCAQVWEQVQAQVWRCGYGTQDAAWLGFYSAFASDLPDVVAPLRPLMALSRLVGWWWPFRGLCIVTPPPLHLHRDAATRLHREDGPAVQYPDGWGLYAWHGARVPAQVIEAPDTLTAPQITAEPNAEVRRVMLERFGATRYLREVGAKRVQGDDYGDLYRVARPDDSDLVMVQVTNSTPDLDGTPKTYWLRVPPQIQSARHAVAWTFGLERPEDYLPVVET